MNYYLLSKTNYKTVVTNQELIKNKFSTLLVGLVYILATDTETWMLKIPIHFELINIISRLLAIKEILDAPKQVSRQFKVINN